jgi:hypothetical protein
LTPGFVATARDSPDGRHDRRAIVACILNEALDPTGKVLVELEPHEARGGRFRTSSRASSAPYAAAALIPSVVRVGYSSRISASLMPAATASRTTLTGIRSPTDVGLAVKDL